MSTILILLCITVLFLISLGASLFFRQNAALRYTILFAGLLGVFLLPFFAFIGQYFSLPSMVIPVLSHDFVVSHEAEHSVVGIAEIVGSEPGLPGSVDTMGEALTTSFIPGLLVMLSLIWILGAGIRLCGIILAAVRLSHWGQKSTDPPDEILEVVASLRQRFTLPRFDLRMTEHVSSPAAFGLFHPMIVLPRGIETCYSPTQLAAILRHEIAHVERRDSWALLLQEILASLLWWHPLVYLFNRQLHHAREEICDLYALQIASPRSYGETLLQITMEPIPRLMSSSSNSLVFRIRRLLDEKRCDQIRSSLGSRMLIYGLCICVASGSSVITVGSVEPDQVWGYEAGLPGIGFPLSDVLRIKSTALVERSRNSLWQWPEFQDELLRLLERESVVDDSGAVQVLIRDDILFVNHRATPPHVLKECLALFQAYGIAFTGEWWLEIQGQNLITLDYVTRPQQFKIELLGTLVDLRLLDSVNSPVQLKIPGNSVIANGTLLTDAQHRMLLPILYRHGVQPLPGKRIEFNRIESGVPDYVGYLDSEGNRTAAQSL